MWEREAVSVGRERHHAQERRRCRLNWGGETIGAQILPPALGHSLVDAIRHERALLDEPHPRRLLPWPKPYHGYGVHGCAWAARRTHHPRPQDPQHSPPVRVILRGRCPADDETACAPMPPPGSRATVCPAAGTEELRRSGATLVRKELMECEDRRLLRRAPPHAHSRNAVRDTIATRIIRTRYSASRGPCGLGRRPASASRLSTLEWSRDRPFRL